MKIVKGKVLRASGFDAPVCGEIRFFDRALFAIGEDGVITAVTQQHEQDYDEQLKRAAGDGSLVDAGEGTYLLPGFVDTHIHAPQYPQAGNALDEPLEVWLNKYTFPLEARYRDPAYAERIYRLLIADLLADGTTTALYFTTIHEQATKLLADLCLELGQRALVGKLVMDNPDTCPDYYRDPDTNSALKSVAAVIDHIDSHPDNRSGLVRPVILPRFIPSCTDAALEGLGEIARSGGCHVHTHCSESDWAHAYVLERHGMTDTASLDRFGLIGRRSVLAHSNFLTAEDMETLKIRQAAVAHCPLSNAWFAGAAFPLRAALEKGLNVGLGSDISGGYSTSILDNCRAAVMTSRLLDTGIDPDLPPGRRSLRGKSRIGHREAFHLATAGGGHALDLPVGIFAPGYHFDAVLVDTRAHNGSIRFADELDSHDNLLEKIVMTASRPNIARVWVEGRLVSGG